MNHLTDEQLESWLAGESAEQTRAHLEGCRQCHAEALALRDGISRYSLALRQQALRAQAEHLPPHFAPRKALALHRLRWTGAAVLATLLAAQTAWMISPMLKSRPTPFVPRAIVNSPAIPQPAMMSDDELLEAVNNDLNREVPQALAPVSAITVARNKIAAASAASHTNDSIKSRRTE